MLNWLKSLFFLSSDTRDAHLLALAEAEVDAIDLSRYRGKLAHGDVVYVKPRAPTAAEVAAQAERRADMQARYDKAVRLQAKGIVNPGNMLLSQYLATPPHFERPDANHPFVKAKFAEVEAMHYVACRDVWDKTMDIIRRAMPDEAPAFTQITEVAAHV